MPSITIKRIYDPREANDGLRVLIDRLWPRGVRKADAAIDRWARDLAPSRQLRTWFNHDPARFELFAERYRCELRDVASIGRRLLLEAKPRPITLLYAARDPAINHAVILRDWLTDLDRA